MNTCTVELAEHEAPKASRKRYCEMGRKDLERARAMRTPIVRKAVSLATALSSGVTPRFGNQDIGKGTKSKWWQNSRSERLNLAGFLLGERSADVNLK